MRTYAERYRLATDLHAARMVIWHSLLNSRDTIDLPGRIRWARARLLDLVKNLRGHVRLA